MSEQTPRDDLVERLRLNFGIHPDWPKSARLAVIDMNAERYQAADRIERLELGLKEMGSVAARLWSELEDGRPTTAQHSATSEAGGA